MPANDRASGSADTSSARRRNIVGAWVAMFCAAGVFVANVSSERRVVERVCEPRQEPLPDLCTTFRVLFDSPWRSSTVIGLLAVWATSGAVAWRSWRQGQLRRNGPPAAFNQRVGIGLLSLRRRVVSVTPGVLAAISFSMRTGTRDQLAETVGPICTSNDHGVEVCRTSTVVVQQTVTTDAGMSSWPHVIAWTLVALTMCWWIYVVVAENLARRFGEENLWRAALRMRRESVPQYPAEQQRGNRY